jgi:hypothetical protein
MIFPARAARRPERKLLSDPSRDNVAHFPKITIGVADKVYACDRTCSRCAQLSASQLGRSAKQPGFFFGYMAQAEQRRAFISFCIGVNA